MSDPPNVNNNMPAGSGRGWFRTPPPTYFRSPSPWVPPGTPHVVQQISTVSSANDRQMAAHFSQQPMPTMASQISRNETAISYEMRHQKTSNIPADRSELEHKVYAFENPYNRPVSSTPQPHLANFQYGHAYQRSMSPAVYNTVPQVERIHMMQIPDYSYQPARETTIPQAGELIQPIAFATSSGSHGAASASANLNEFSKPSQYVIYDTSDDGPSTADIIAKQSQDYIDEKLAEYQATIFLLQDEQERVQKKTFVNWINSFLCKRNPPLSINDIIQDLKDGTKLLALLEVLSGERLPTEKGKVLRRPHYLSNINTALQFLTNKRIKLVNINPSDIVDGRPAVVLGLIWTIILYFQIEENSRILHYLNENLSGSVSSLDSGSVSHIPSPSKPFIHAVPSTIPQQDVMKQGPKKTLLSWVNNALPKQSGLEVRDFGASWRDGFAFLSLIDAIKTNLINIAEMKKFNNRHRLDTAFNVAESELGIARLLDAEDVDVTCPDEKCIMTYVAQFLHKYPDVKNINSKSDSEQELLYLLDWLRDKVRYYDTLNGNYPLSYDKYESSLLEKTEKWNTYKKFKNIYASKSVFEIQELSNLWAQLENHMQLWLWYLDCHIPGQIGVIGLWLSNGEKLLNDDDIPSCMNEETASLISKKLEAHKQFFVSYPEVLETFNDLKQRNEAKAVPINQIKFLEKRLLEIEPRAKHRRIRLKFLEHKCCLIAFLNLLETKINGVKYDNEEVVKQSLDQLKNFVTKNQILQEFEKALDDMRQVIEEYKIDGNISKKEGYHIDTFLADIEGRWKNVSSRLICTETMLEDVLVHWQKWRVLTNELENWIKEAQNALQMTEDEQIYFFQNLSKFKAKQDLLTDTYNVLKSTCDYDTAIVIEHRYRQIMIQWEQVFKKSKQYMHVGDILQHRQKFKTDAARLSDWIAKANETLSRTNMKNSKEIIKCEHDIKQIACEIESMEELFKSISRSFQALIKEYSRDEVDKMMHLMKKEKEALVCIRAQIPIKLHLFHQILTQQEALESGQKEISSWLDEAESLLISYAFTNDPEQTNNNIMKHKSFFSRTLYYKSMLESKNNVYQNLFKLSNTDKSVDFSDTSAIMKQLNERFSYVINNANDWEYKLQENKKIWENFNASLGKVESFIRQADLWQNASIAIEKKSEIENQLDFFRNVDQSMIAKLETHTEELLKFLPPQEQIAVITKVETIQKQWSDIISKIPCHILKLEFKTNEITFNNCIHEIEKELNAEEQAFNHNANYETILQRNANFFQANDLQKVEKLLATLERTNCVYGEQFPNDMVLFHPYQRANDKWIAVCKRVENVKSILYKIPAQWEAYRDKFIQMTNWMDSVDKALKKIIVEKDSTQQFEAEKAEFQRICFEAESRKEDMKWLVKTLDYLLNHTNEEQVGVEQEKIEKLIARYKTLIPCIESTMINVETFAKCYTYRSETREVCDLLNKIRTQNQNLPCPDNFRKVNDMIEEQNFSIKELDNQRAHIMNIIQRGRDLGKNVNSPNFIAQEVENLERCWNETYSETANKIKSLMEVKKVWNTYNEQRGQIVDLLKSAEIELRSITPLQTNPRNVTEDLDTKKHLVANLRQALEKSCLALNDLCRELGQHISVSSKPIIEKETSDLEKRVASAANQVERRIEYLEDYNNKWNEYKTRLDSLKSWANYVYPKMVAAIKQPHISPEDRVVKTMQLENVMAEKMKILDILNASTSDLASKEGNLDEMKRLKSEVVQLCGTFSNLNHVVITEKAQVHKDLANWKDIGQAFESIKMWTEQAEKTPDLEHSKIGSLPEAKQLKANLDSLNEQCKSKIGELKNIASKCNDIRYGNRPTEEIDGCFVRLTDLNENSQHMSGKLDKLVANWSVLNDELKKQEAYVIASQEKLQASLSESLSELPIDKLEEKIKMLKLHNNEVSEQQAKLITLVHLFDQLSCNLANESIVALRDRLNKPKEDLAKINEGLRDLINNCYEKIVVQQNFNALMNDFSDWMDQMRVGLAELEETVIDEIDLALQNVQYLQQQHANKQDVFDQIYTHVKQHSLSEPGKDNSVLNETYSSLASNYQNLEASLEKLKNVLRGWSEFSHWAKNTKDELHDLEESVTSDIQPREQDLGKVGEKLANIKLGIAKWRKDIIGLEHQPCIKVCDQLNRPVNAVAVIVDLENKLSSIQSHIDAKEKEVQDANIRAERFKDLYQDMIDDLNITSNSLQNVPKKARLGNLEECLKELDEIRKQLDQVCSVKAKMQNEADLLLKQNVGPAKNIQECFPTLEKNITKVRNKVDEMFYDLTSILELYNDFNRCNSGFKNELKNIIKINASTALTFNDKPTLVESLEKLKNSSVIMKNLKKKGDLIANTGNEIVKKFQNYNTEDCETIQKIIAQNNEDLKVNLQTLIDGSNLLDQRLSLYTEIENLFHNIITGLDKIQTQLSRFPENPTEMEHRISTVKLELPNYLALKQNFDSLVTNFEQSNNNVLPKDIAEMEEKMNALFAQVNHDVRELSDKVSEYSTQERSVKDQIRIIIDNLYSIREEIIKNDDSSLDSVKQLQALDNLKKIRQKLNLLGVQLTELKNDFVGIETKFNTIKENTIGKEIKNLEQRFGCTMNSLNEVENKLSKLVEHSFKDKLTSFGRIVASHTEKIKWCHPESGSDRHNLESKKATLKDVKEFIAANEGAIDGISNVLQSIAALFNPAKVTALNELKCETEHEFEQLKVSCSEIEKDLDENINLWQQYEETSGEIIQCLKNLEQKHKLETILLIDLNSLNDKIKEIDSSYDSLKEYEPKLKLLQNIANSINQLNPDSRVLMLVQHLLARFNTFEKYFSNMLDRLHDIQSKNNKFHQELDKARDWIKSMEQQKTSPEKTYDELTARRANIMGQESSINETCAIGESLYAEISPESRDEIREDILSLRNAFNSLVDECNVAIKCRENDIMNKKSIDESFIQIFKWLADLQNKLSKRPALYTTLQDKKAALSNYNTMLKDAKCHETSFDQLQHKLASLASVDFTAKIAEAREKFALIYKDLSSTITLLEDYVNQHTNFDNLLVKSRNWLFRLQSQYNELLSDHEPNKVKMEENLMVLESIISEEAPVFDNLNECFNQFTLVMGQTHENGHSVLLKAFESNKQDWKQFFETCKISQQKQKATLGLLANAAEKLDRSLAKMAAIREKIKEQSSKVPSSANQDCTNELVKVNNEIVNYGADIRNLIEECQPIKSNNEIANKITQVQNEYNSLASFCSESLERAKAAVNEHSDFNLSYDEIINTLNKNIASLQEHKQLVGDLSVLQNRQLQLKEIAYKRLDYSNVVENVIIKGEKLCTQISSDGREAIRNKQAELRKLWDRFTDELEMVTQQVDLCILQFGEFSAQQEQLSKWLKDIEHSMKVNAELKSNVQEKRTQYQNHKLIHQEVLSQTGLLESVCSKAQQLLVLIQDQHLQTYLVSIKDTFKNIVQKSNELLNHLDNSVNTHTNFEVLSLKLKKWITEEHAKALLCEDGGGEKSEISKRIETLKGLKAARPRGEEMIAQLLKLHEINKTSTAPPGITALEDEIKKMRDEFDSLYREIDAQIESQANLLSTWAQFDKELDLLTKWCRSMEAIFREQQLFDSLETKRNHLQIYKNNLALVVEKRKSIDDFATSAQALFSLTGVEKIKLYINQLINRYQLLQVLSKEVTKRNENIVADHVAYEEKLLACNTAIDAIKAEIEATSIENVPSQIGPLLQKFDFEKDRIENSLVSLVAIHEKVLPETNAQGREKLREDVKNIKERWSRVLADIINWKKQCDVRTVQWSSYQDILQQLLAWLNATENKIDANESQSWTSTQEIRSKLFKYKALLQEITSQKRMIDSLNEKAIQVSANKNSEVPAEIQSVNARYEMLKKSTTDTIGRLERALAVCAKFNELNKAHLDEQEILLSDLKQLSDVTGSKKMIKDKIQRVRELQSLVPKRKEKLDNLEQIINENRDFISPGVINNMEQDLLKIRTEFDKFNTSIEDALKLLEKRLTLWDNYQQQLDHINNALVEIEESMQNYCLKNSLPEKQQQHELYQELCGRMKQINHLFDNLLDKSTELLHSSNDAKITSNMQQMKTKMQTTENTVKEIAKLCDQAYQEHKAFKVKYDECDQALNQIKDSYDESIMNCSDISNVMVTIGELISKQNLMGVQCSRVSDMGDMLYSTTASEGQQEIRSEIQNLQQKIDRIFDEIDTYFKSCETRLSRLTVFNDKLEQSKNWLSNLKENLLPKIILKPTLDEKIAQHQAYIDIANELKNYKPEVDSLKDLANSMQSGTDDVVSNLNQFSTDFTECVERCQSFVEAYEKIVSNHRHYCKAVMDTSDFIDVNHNTIELWGDTDLDQVSLITNLDRIIDLKKTILEETNRIELLRDLGNITMPDTSDDGQVNIRSQIDVSQQEWEGLLVTMDSTIEKIQSKIAEWNEYESMRTNCIEWMRSIDSSIHSIDLKATLDEKKATLDYLKTLQGEVKAKELEIDSFTDKGQQLYVGYLTSRNSQVSELAIKYQQTSSRVKELTSRWQQYVIDHQELSSQIENHRQWLNEIKEKINYCSDTTATTEKELQSKIKIIQDLLINKDEGTARMQTIIDLSQQVLACTIPTGHDEINRAICSLQDEWSTISLRMIDVKSFLDEALNQWSGFLDQVSDLKTKITWLENEFAALSVFESTMADKRAQLDRIKDTEEKIRIERIEIEPLRQRAADMSSGQKTQAASAANQALGKFDYIAERVSKLLTDREDQYRDHRVYKEAYDDLSSWVNRAREKIPCAKQQSLSDKLTIDNAIAPLDSLLNKKAQGELLVEHLVHTGEVVMASTSPAGRELINADIVELKQSFEKLFQEIESQKRNFEKTNSLLREYKDEYERLSEWLQQIDIIVKNNKLAMSSNIQDKGKQVKDMQDIMAKLDAGRADLEKFNSFAAPLLQSHLDSYISNQLRHLNSRYQVQVNITKDVLKKVESNYDLHKEYDKNISEANRWIENAKEIVRCCTEHTEHVSKENLEKRLVKIIELMQSRERGQALVNNSINLGEKVLKSTKSDGKEVINNEMKEVQNSWDRIVKKMSTAKVHLETSLLQWADYNSSYNHLQQWIQDRESKLQRVSEHKTVRFKAGTPTSISTGLNERRATLRQANDIVQDIVSFEPMIHSVASKASDLHQTSPASEISKKYENLSTQAKELFAKQKETVEMHQAFIDSSNEFAAWIRHAKESLNKCSDPRGDRDSLVSKMTQLKILDKDVDIGQKKLEKALEQADIACRNVHPDECEAIEKEVALLQEEFDNYSVALRKISAALENGIVRWKEYDNQYTAALNWLDKLEQDVQAYNKMQNSLEQKKVVLEEFQEKLQTLFDWQRELDNLNIKAQVLLDICADTRVSNGITQLTTKYNVLLSIAKEIMRRLELHYQEHQQHNTLFGECQDWLDRIHEKLNECNATPQTILETQSKLNIIKGIRQSLEQGQNKLRYLFELKEKIIISTEANGATKIAEDTDGLKVDYESLMSEVNEVRQRLLTHLANLEDVSKLLKVLSEWVEEVNKKIDDVPALNEFSDKRVILEKFRTFQRETTSYNDIRDKIQTKMSENPVLANENNHKILNEYEALVTKIGEEIKRLENQVNNYERFRQGLQELYVWMKHTRQNIEKLSDYHGDRDHIVEKLTKVKNIEMSLSEGKVLLENANEIGNNLLTIIDQDGHDAVKREISQAISDWEEIENLSDTICKGLNDVLASWESFYDKSNCLSLFISEYKAKVAALDDPDNNMKSLKYILEIILTKKSSVEELNDVCEALMEKSACPTVRDQTVDLQKSYSSLLSNLQGLIAKQEKNVASHTEYLYYKEELLKWIEDANQAITASQEKTSDDLRDTKRKITDMQNLSNSIPQGTKLFEMLQDSFTKSSYLHSEEKQTDMFHDITELRDSLDAIILKINTTLNDLNVRCNRLELYEELKKRILDWLNVTEGVFKTMPETRGEMSDVRTVLERIKHIHYELSFKQADIDTINLEASNLFDATRSSIEIDSVNNLSQRSAKLNEQCCYFIKSLQAELEDQMNYYQSLQEVEKWLLQISFQLMAHNSLYIHNREQTLEQITQHEKLLAEIQSYQTNIDDINVKGQAQIDRYVLSAPEIKVRIENQMKNIRDSYNSLLNTSVQIKNRLHDSLNKFQEYEDTLDDIIKNLDEMEPEMENEKAVVITDFKTGKAMLEKSQEYQRKLHLEKSRLFHAIQACEAATASISRPSSPVEMSHQVIPEKELLVRARLEDVTDEVQTWIADLIAIINKFEAQMKEKNELEQWIRKHNVIVNDWRLKPNKLRTEAAELELRQMKNLQADIANKIQQTQNLDVPLQEELEQLSLNLEQAIAEKVANQFVIDKYRKCHGDIQNRLDSINQQIDDVEKGSGFNCKQKLEKLMNINDSLTGDADDVAIFKEKASQVNKIVNNLDGQQIAEQVKIIERKHNEIRKKLSRKLDALNATNKTYATISSDMMDIENWLTEKSKLLNTPCILGADVKSAETQQEVLKKLLKETEGKHVLLDVLGKRYLSVQANLEPEEKLAVEKNMQGLSQKFNHLLADIRKEIEKNVEEVLCRRNMANNFEMIRTWIRTKQQDIDKISDRVPLLASNVQSEIKLCQRHENTIKEFEDNAFKDLLRQAREITKDCTDEGRQKLSGDLEEIKSKLETLFETCACKIAYMQQELQKRCEFEKRKEQFLNWLSKAESIVSLDINTNGITVLKEQKLVIADMCEQCAAMKQSLKELEAYKASIVPTLSQTDENNVESQMKIINEKWNAINNALNIKHKKLSDHIEEYQLALDKVNSCSEFLTQVQKNIRDLNKPIASKIDNIQDILLSYESILSSLKDRRLELSTILLANIPQLKENKTKIEEMINTIEEQLRRLKTMLNMRDQFLGAINEVVKSLAKINTDFNELDTLSNNTEERLSRHAEILHQINLCATRLATATDKGHAIAREGTDFDRQNIMDQLHSLQQQLDSIRKTVEAAQEKYKKQHQFLQATNKELTILLDWFQQNNDLIKSRPLYSEDVNISAGYVANNEKLGIQARNNLNQTDELLNKINSKIYLPADLQHKVAHAQEFLKTLPAELAARDSYIQENHKQRKVYAESIGRLNDWFEVAEKQLSLPTTFKTELDEINSSIADLESFLASEQDMRNLLFHDIQEQADQFWNTLDSVDQERCLAELNSHKARLSEISHQGAVKQNALLKNIDDMQRYLTQHQKVVDCLNKIKIDDALMALPTLPARIDHISELLQIIQGDRKQLDALNEITNKIIAQLNQYDSNKIRKDNAELNRVWTDDTTQLQNHHENLVQLQHEWIQLESILQELETKLNYLLEKNKGLDVVVKSKVDMLAKIQALENLLEDKTVLEELNKKANSLAKTLIVALREQQLSPHSLEQKLNHLNQVDTELTDDLSTKRLLLQNKLQEIQHFSNQISTLYTATNQLLEELQKINTFDEKLYKTESTLKQIKAKAENLSRKKEELHKQIHAKYSTAQQFVPEDLTSELNALENLLKNICSDLEKCERSFKRAKIVRTDYFELYDKVKTWIENAEITISNHNIDPSEMKAKLLTLTSSCDEIRLLFDKLVSNGKEIIENSSNSNDKLTVQINIDQISQELDKTILLIQEKNKTIDHILGNWAEFMRLYQLVLGWASRTRELLERKLQLNSIHEAHTVCQYYSNAVSTLGDVSQHLSEMNREFDTINDVCSTAFLKRKLHEAETVKVDSETTLLERNLFLQETKEEWQQCVDKIESVKGWIKESYDLLGSSELRSKPLRDQMRILEQMLADISAQKIKVNMSLEKLQVHFHSEIVCTDNSNIMQCGRSIIGDLEKLNHTVYQTTQSLENTLSQIEDCQQELLSIRQSIVQEEQQLRNILSPLHQSDESDKLEQECRDRVRSLQSQQSQINNKIKLLLQRDAPE
ncbi:muscle-specific protein 300 kDa isoform X3 [Wyeomyia smithii]|uniref:muscle-specific protein 300 kDa isoform X3 n=1 Tax=Wyeomyia smithii TaxID=174621 RepID=UPI0024680BB2|nr:muscle-specific protein 300 kDa isoform X3 [Wyeomyia smithii]